MSLLEPDVWNLGALAGVPAKGRPPEPLRVVDEEKNELEGVRESEVVTPLYASLAQIQERYRQVHALERLNEDGEPVSRKG